MTDRNPSIMVALTAAQDWLTCRSGYYMGMSSPLKNAMPLHRPTMFSLFSWFSGLFMRDGRPLEFLSGAIILGWAYVSDLLTDRNKTTASMDGVVTLIRPEHLVTIGYVLGVAQLIALVTLDRRLRAPTAFFAGLFVGILTAGVWKGPLAPAIAFYIGIWAANVYVFIRLCRPKP